MVPESRARLREREVREDPARVRRRRRRRSKAGRERGRDSEELPALRTKPPLASDPDRTEDNRGSGEARMSFVGRIRPKVRVFPPLPPVAWRRVEAEEKNCTGEPAVVKCSCDPRKDLKESVVEKIWEKGIGRPEELERLQACYLAKYVTSLTSSGEIKSRDIQSCTLQNYIDHPQVLA